MKNLIFVLEAGVTKFFHIYMIIVPIYSKYVLDCDKFKNSINVNCTSRFNQKNLKKKNNSNSLKYSI